MKYCWCPAFAALLPGPYADSNRGPASSRQLEGVVGLACLDLLERARWVDPDRDHDLVEMVRAVAAGSWGSAAEPAAGEACTTPM